MPKIYYQTPGFRTFVAQNLKGYDLKTVKPWGLNFDLPRLEIRSQGKLLAKVHSGYAEILDKAIERDLTGLATEYESKYSTDDNKIKIELDCQFPKE